jgi:hypothetical protein
MTTTHTFEIPYLWQFIDENFDGAGVFAAVAVSDNEAHQRNIAIKGRDDQQFFAVTLYKADWAFPKDEDVSVRFNFFDGKPETLTGYGDGKILDILLPISAAPMFLYLLASSEALEISPLSPGDEPWLLNLVFAGAIMRKMISRFMALPDFRRPLNQAIAPISTNLQSEGGSK